MMSIMALSSCDKEEYEPLPIPTGAGQILVECIGNNGRTILDDPKFIDKISIEGQASHSKINYDIRNSGIQKCLAFNAEMPNQLDMKWNKEHTEASGISKMTIKFGKNKVTLSCHIKYVANRPPAAAGGCAILEEVSCNGMNFKRSGNSVTITLRMDKNGKLL